MQIWVKLLKDVVQVLRIKGWREIEILEVWCRQAMLAKGFHVSYFQWENSCKLCKRICFPANKSIIHFQFIIIREGCTKLNPEKVWSFAKLPSAPNFTLGPTSKTNKFPLLFLVIVGQNSQHKRAKSDTFKVVFKARYIFKQLQTKCKTCFGGPRMILHAKLKNTFPK